MVFDGIKEVGDIPADLHRLSLQATASSFSIDQIEDAVKKKIAQAATINQRFTAKGLTVFSKRECVSTQGGQFY